MISRIIFTIIISSLFFSAIGQTKKNCEVLDALLKYDEARKVFFFDKHKDLPITFIDVNIIFNDCAFNDYYGRKVQIVHDSSYIKAENYSSIMVSSFKKTRNVCKMSIYYKIRNAFYRIEFKRKNHGIVVSKFSGGYF